MNWSRRVNFWPFNRKARLAEAQRVKEIKEEFRVQLINARSRRGDLNEITEQLRKAREEPGEEYYLTT